MSIDKQGDLRIDSWLIKIFLTNGTEKTIVELPDEISQSIDDYLSEIQEELIYMTKLTPEHFEVIDKNKAKAS